MCFYSASHQLVNIISTRAVQDRTRTKSFLIFQDNQALSPKRPTEWIKGPRLVLLRLTTREKKIAHRFKTDSESDRIYKG